MALGPYSGTAQSVQGGPNGSQAAGGISGLFGGRTQKAQDPNAAAYDQERNAAQANANNYSNQATTYTQAAPTISNQYQGESRANIGGNVADQRNLANTLENNTGEASKAQFQHGLDQSIASQMAIANSTNGGATQRAGAVRNAQQTGALTQAAGASTAAELGAREREAALGQAAGVRGQIGNELQNQYGVEQGTAIHQGDLDLANQGQQNAYRLGMGGLGNQAQAQSEGALNDYTTQNLNSQELSANMKHNNAKDTNDAIGTIAGIAGTALGGFLATGGPMHPGPSHDVNMATMYGQSPNANAPKQVTLADALAGIEHLKKRVMQLEGRHG